MAGKITSKISLIAIALVLLAVGTFAYPLASAQSSTTSTQTSNPVYVLAYNTCAGSNGSGSIIDPARSIINVNNSAAQSLLSVSLVIMLIFSMLAAAAYGMGYAFHFDRLTKFARSEMNEIIITILVVLIFVGTFAVGNSVIGPNSHLFAAGGGKILNNNVFISDCSLLYYNGYQI
ncbi:MAG: hypothetical protein KGH66_02915, partial [Candidatus Micrarchaeota archaeon]|nr:hypothetical protein [Candidatus Micrarchaeota archaeon]